MQDLASSEAVVPDACVVLTTLPDEARAEALAGRIVEERLGACVQLLPIRSVYAWEGRLCREPEWLLLVKTRAAVFPELQEFIRANHPYEVPEILQLPVAAGLPAYLGWLAGAVRP